MLTATNVLQKIFDHAEKNQLSDRLIDIALILQQVRDRGEEIFGYYIAQGDINLWLLPAIPEGAIAMPPNSQLAIGTTTGSRHCIRLEDIGKVDFYGFADPNPLEGPILVFREAIVIEHPEHRHQLWPAGAIVGVTYQRRHAEELRRVQD